MKCRVACTLLLFLISSCVGLAIKEKVVGNYYLVAADTDEELSLSYYEPADGDNYSTFIKATVFAVGFNDSYMIIKQHPRAFPNPPDKSVTNFYILPLREGFNWRTNNGLIGPLTLEQFDVKRKELHITDLKFSIEKENLK